MFSPLQSSSFDYISAGLGAHSDSEAVSSNSLNFTWLIGSLSCHDVYYSLTIKFWQLGLDELWITR